VINKALLKEDNNGNSPIVIVDFPRDSQLRQGRGRSLMPLIQYQVPGESYRAKNPYLAVVSKRSGKGAYPDRARKRLKDLVGGVKQGFAEM
jgi:hypothetical protein